MGDFPVGQGYGPASYAGEPPGHGYSHWHSGEDIPMPIGTPLVLPFDATVTDRTNPGGFGTYQTVVPDADPKHTFILGHESRWDVKSGHYAQGTQTGESGSSGNSTGPHLHFEEDVGGPPYAANNDVNPSVALAGGLPYESQQASSISTFGASQSGQNPYGALDPRAWVWEAESYIGGTLFTRDHLIRGAFIIGGSLIILIGLVILTRAYERVPEAIGTAAKTAAALTPEGAAAETAADAVA